MGLGIYYGLRGRKVGNTIVVIAVVIFLLGYWSSRPPDAPVQAVHNVPVQASATPMIPGEAQPEYQNVGAGETAAAQAPGAYPLSAHDVHVAEMKRTIELRQQHASGYHLPPAAQDDPSSGMGSGYSGGSSRSSSSHSTGGSVHVNSYTRKDGTVVQAHTRKR
jgi:hypothetical protein